MSRSRAGVAALLSALFVLPAVGCGAHEETEKTAAPVVAARTVVVTAQPFTETLAAIGTVAPRAGHVATLAAPSPGRLARVLVSQGQAVHDGDVLAELDHAPFQAALDAARAAFTAAEQANERQQRLASEGIVPRKDAEAAAADLARARADVVTAERSTALATLRAPIDGVVTRMTATIGASVDPTQPLVEIADPAALDILLNATPSDAGRVHAGAAVVLTTGASGGGESVGRGTVVDVAAAVDSASRTVAIRVQPGAMRRPLKIGETIFGTIALGTRANAIVVPNDALVPDGESFKVFVVDADSIAHQRDVSVGGTSDGVTEILNGLAAGERVVTGGAFGVSDSAKVQSLKLPTPRSEP